MRPMVSQCWCHMVSPSWRTVASQSRSTMVSQSWWAAVLKADDQWFLTADDLWFLSVDDLWFCQSLWRMVFQSWWQMVSQSLWPLISQGKWPMISKSWWPRVSQQTTNILARLSTYSKSSSDSLDGLSGPESGRVVEAKFTNSFQNTKFWAEQVVAQVLTAQNCYKWTSGSYFLAFSTPLQTKQTELNRCHSQKFSTKPIFVQSLLNSVQARTDFANVHSRQLDDTISQPPCSRQSTLNTLSVTTLPRFRRGSRVFPWWISIVLVVDPWQFHGILRSVCAFLQSLVNVWIPVGSFSL